MLRNLLLSILLVLPSAFAQSNNTSAQDWTLPGSLALKQSAPRSWRFICDYYTLSTKGSLIKRSRVSAIYTRGLPGDKVRWSEVSIAAGNDYADKFDQPKAQAYMEGFTYPYADQKNSMTAEFFKTFPPMAYEARNMVWDTHMFEYFGQEMFDKLKLNVAYHVPDEGGLSLAGTGTFRNRDLQLTWLGKSLRSGKECALVHYSANFNPLEMKSPGMTMVGRSNFSGDIWVSMTTKQIEYATLYEDVLSEISLSSLEKPMILDVVRVGTFEPIN